jgi:hypothetical protein
MSEELFDGIYSPIDTIKNEADTVKNNINIYLPLREKNTPEENRKLFLDKVKSQINNCEISYPHIFKNINYQNEKCIKPTSTFLKGTQPPNNSLLNCKTLEKLRDTNLTFNNTCSKKGGKKSKSSKTKKSKKSSKTKKSKTIKCKHKCKFKY